MDVYGSHQCHLYWMYGIDLYTEVLKRYLVCCACIGLTIRKLGINDRDRHMCFSVRVLIRPKGLSAPASMASCYFVLVFLLGVGKSAV